MLKRFSKNICRDALLAKIRLAEPVPCTKSVNLVKNFR